MVKKYGRDAVRAAFFLIITLLVFMVLPSFIVAQGNLKVGPLRIHPSFQISEEYSDNIYHVSEDEDFDFLTKFSPSLRLQLPLRKHLIELGYKAVFIEATHEENYSTTDQLADFLLYLMFSGGLEIKLTNYFNDTSTPPESSMDKRNDYITNDSVLGLAFGFAKRWRIALDYTHTFKNFDHAEDEKDNYVEDTAKSTIFVKFMPKTSFLLEYRYSHRDNEDLDDPTTSDNVTHVAHAGLSWDPDAKIRGAIKGGYARKVWDAGAVDDEKTLSIDTDVVWDMTKKITLGLKSFRKIVETLESLERAGGSGFGMTYVATGANLSATHRPGSKTKVKLEFSYSHDEYNGMSGTKDRKDERLGGALSINYRIQEWLSLGLRYNYTDSDSNIDGQDYSENRGMLYINLAP